MIIIPAGSTSQTIDVFIPDSSSTTGAGRTGLVFNTAGLTCFYRKTATGTSTAVTLVTQTVAGAYSSGGFVEIDATNMPGMYRLDLPNAAVDTAGFVSVILRGASNMAPVPIRIHCADIPANVRQIAGAAVATGTAQLGVNVVQYGGVAGTFAAGRPEVNATHWGGTAVASANVRANVVQVAGQTASAAAGVTFPASIGTSTLVATDIVSGGAITTSAGAVSTVNSVANAVTVGTINANTITAASIAASALNGKGDWNIGKTGYALAASGVDAVVIETGLNLRQATSIIAASAAGTLSGAATTTITIDGAGVAADRIVATVDANGNRTAVTLTPPA